MPTRQIRPLFILVAAICVGCSLSSNGKVLKEIIAEGDYCTETTQSSCKIGGYSVLTPAAKTIAEMLDSKNIDEFIPSQSCVGNRFLDAKIEGELYRFCEVNRLPNSYSLDEKKKLIRKEPRI